MHLRAPLSRNATLFFASGISLTLLAAVPDAGQLLRDLPKIPETERGLPMAAPIEAQESASAHANGMAVQARQFRFTGYEGLIREEELQACIAPLIGKKLSVPELQGAANTITALLRQKGFLLARAYLPRQDITDGSIEVSIVQARVDGHVSIKQDASCRISKAQLQALADASISPDKPLNEYGLEQALLHINDLPGVMGRVLLEQGRAPGSTQVSLNISQASLLSGSVWADNFGSRYSGAIRGNGLLFVNDPFGLGDQYSVLLSGAEDMKQGRLSYSTPFGHSGLKANLSGSFLRYAIGKEFAALDLKGDALTLNGWITYPLILRRDQGITLSLGYEFKSLADEALETDTRDRRLHSGSLGLNGYFRDALGGGGYTAWSGALTAGNTDLHRIPADKFVDRNGPGAAGDFIRLNLSLSRQQYLPYNFSASVAYFGQLAGGNLNSSEKMSLGGPYGVRAYPVGEASGDEAHQFNLELRRDFVLSGDKGRLQCIGFFDTGFVRLNKDRWAGDVVTATGKNSYQLSGAGTGLNYTWRDRLSLRTSYAWKIASNPGRSREGNDSDGRSDGGCLWISCQYRF